MNAVLSLVSQVLLLSLTVRCQCVSRTDHSSSNHSLSHFFRKHVSASWHLTLFPSICLKYFSRCNRSRRRLFPWQKMRKSYFLTISMGSYCSTLPFFFFFRISVSKFFGVCGSYTDNKPHYPSLTRSTSPTFMISSDLKINFPLLLLKIICCLCFRAFLSFNWHFCVMWAWMNLLYMFSFSWAKWCPTLPN